MVLRDRLMEAIGTLGLYGMKATFDEVLAAGIKSRATPEKIICDLWKRSWQSVRQEAFATAWAWQSSR